nr:protein kinase, ATP binding site-containing protein [Tanacetum cinerariifolium]
MDPIYEQSHIVNTEVDVYCFGLVMFEILSGLIMVSQTTFKRRVHLHYGDNKIDKLIDPNIRDQIDGRSLQTFAETAYRCLSYNIKERPSMNRIIKKIEEALYFQKHGAAPSTTAIPSQQHRQLEDLLIPFKEIKMASNDFNKNSQIGVGGFGVVYVGRLSERWPNHEVAIKRLDKTGHQGKKEFLNELRLISRFHHQNIIPFVGYCDEGDEMILVYNYAINGSLDNHLQGPKRKCRLTWVQRLKICFGAAKGLDYLHTGLGEANRVIHRDIKSGNILLDDNLEAKICDFGLSKSDSTYRQQKQSKLYTKVAGTGCYTDPIYHESGILRTESDVYSFGVVMFEMLSGMPAWHRRSFGHDKPQPLINLVRRYYDYGKDLLIDPQIKAQIDKNSFHTFIEIAYRCISFNSNERPTMEMIADKIEEALDFQVKKDVSGNYTYYIAEGTYLDVLDLRDASLQMMCLYSNGEAFKRKKLMVTNEVGANMGKNSNYGVDIDRDSNMASLNSRATPVEPVSYAKIINGEPSRKALNFVLYVPRLFSSKDEMDAMTENGSWLIRNVPLILKKWTPVADIMKIT